MCVALGAKAADIRAFAAGHFTQTSMKVPEPDRNYFSGPPRAALPRMDSHRVPFVIFDERAITSSGRGGVQEALTSRPAIKNGRFARELERPDSELKRRTQADYWKDSVRELLGVEDSALGLALADAAFAISDPLEALERLREDLDNRLNPIRPTPWLTAPQVPPPLWVRDLRVFTRDPALFRVYLANLLGHFGLLPGFALREVVAEAAVRFGPPRLRLAPGAAELTFRSLYDATGVELAVTGTHMASRRTQMFSYRTTPEFRVVPAVCLSMTFPFLFKPIMVSQDPDPEDPDNPEKQDHRVMPPSYQGLWTDGGMARQPAAARLPRTRRPHPPPAGGGLPPRPADAFRLGEHRRHRPNPPDPRILPGDARPHRSLAPRSWTPTSPRSCGLGRQDSPRSTWSSTRTRSGRLRRRPVPPSPTTSRSWRRPCTPVILEWHRRAKEHRDYAVDGDLFEAIVRAQFRARFPIVSPGELTVEAFKLNRRRRPVPSGKVCQVDIVIAPTLDPATWWLIEAEGSATAPLSTNQKEAHPLLIGNGGVLESSQRDPLDLEGNDEWAPFREPVTIVPQRVEVVRPANLFKIYVDLASGTTRKTTL